MANVTKIEQFIKEMKKFTDKDGFEWALLAAEYNDDHLVAEFVPYAMKADDSWQENDVRSLLIEYDMQEVESVSGHEYPVHESVYVTHDDPAFDRDMAIAQAFDEALEYLRERRVSHAA